MAHAQVPTNCFFTACGNPALEAEIAVCKDLCYRYNQLHPNDAAARTALLHRLLGHVGEGATVVSPFWCDYGYRIRVGVGFYANHNLVIQDGASVTFGDHVFVGPNCCLTTAEHALDPAMRRAGIEVAKPITIGSDVWIGAGCTVLAGVRIGDRSVIGAGSVVTKDIPPDVVAVGVPCRVLRPITEEDKTTYPMWQPDPEPGGAVPEETSAGYDR